MHSKHQSGQEWGASEQRVRELATKIQGAVSGVQVIKGVAHWVQTIQRVAGAAVQAINEVTNGFRTDAKGRLRGPSDQRGCGRSSSEFTGQKAAGFSKHLKVTV